MRIVGVDPGFTGGIALLTDDGTVRTWPMPTIRIAPSGYTNRSQTCLVMSDIVSILYAGNGLPHHVFLEKVHAMPGQGVRSMFTFGESYGMLQGIFAALMIPYTLVTPQVWQKVMLDGFPKPILKETKMLAAKRLFPTTDFRPPHKRTDHDGIADALLIAEYGRRLLTGKGGTA